jgi:hypothetical protein
MCRTLQGKERNSVARLYILPAGLSAALTRECSVRVEPALNTFELLEMKVKLATFMQKIRMKLN